VNILSLFIELLPGNTTGFQRNIRRHEGNWQGNIFIGAFTGKLAKK
jgi:hypothetical protein